MKTAPSLLFKEFDQYTVRKSTDDDFNYSERNHPEWGIWSERVFDSGHIRVYEHRAQLNQPLTIKFNNTDSGNYVHHCISLGGSMGAYFPEHEVEAVLAPKTYHHVFLPFEAYELNMDKEFVNIHIEIHRDFYSGLLSDNENWAADIREKLKQQQTYYTGRLMLTPEMISTIHAIFLSPLSGSLKKLLIEARVQELVALQLNRAIQPAHNRRPASSQADLFVPIREYLDQHFLEEHSLRSLCRQFGINEFALKKGFREQFNTTVFDYLLGKRLEYSVELLKGSSKTIEEISAVVGYKYPNHFSAAFKKRYGSTPAMFRK